MNSLFCDLTAFRDWWMSSRIINTPPGGVTFQKDSYGVVLFREGCYQVELFIMKPSMEVVEHIHPDVDTYEVHVSGEVTFLLNGLFPSTQKRNLGDFVRVAENVPHSAFIEGSGGAFISIQKWLNGVPPTSVTMNWLGKDGSTSYDTSGKED